MDMRPGFKQTDAGRIPEDWESTSLQDIVEFGNGRPHEGDVTAHGQYFLITLDSIGADGQLKAEHKRLDHYDGSLRRDDMVTVLSTVVSNLEQGNILGLCDLIPEDNKYVLNQRMGRLRIRGDGVPQFVRLQMNRRRDHFQSRGQGTSQKHIYRRDIYSLAIPFPSTIEQRAIAAALSDADALLGGLDRLIAKKRDLKQAAMQQLLTDQTRLPGFSGAWEELEFGEIASIRNAKVVASSVPSGTQCVELESIGGEGSGRLLMSTDATGMSSKYSFKKGDVLFGRLRAYLRKYWLATFDGICSTEIWPLIARDARLCGAFLHLLVQTNEFVNAAGVSYGTHMPRSDWTVLSKLVVRLPPLPEQTAIAAVLSDMDAELAALEARRDKTRDLKQAMMQELLTGRTRLL